MEGHASPLSLLDISYFSYGAQLFWSMVSIIHSVTLHADLHAYRLKSTIDIHLLHHKVLYQARKHIKLLCSIYECIPHTAQTHNIITHILHSSLTPRTYEIYPIFIKTKTLISSKNICTISQIKLVVFFYILLHHIYKIRKKHT